MSETDPKTARRDYLIAHAPANVMDWLPDIIRFYKLENQPRIEQGEDFAAYEARADHWRKTSQMKDYHTACYRWASLVMGELAE